jgi:hypothetical protein
MYKEYKDILDEVGKYIHHLEETILNYESKLADMELEDMIEPVVDHGLTEKYPGKSKYYYNRLKGESFEDQINKTNSHEEWAYSKTKGDDDEARREALRKSQARAEIERKKLDSLE